MRRSTVVLAAACVMAPLLFYAFCFHYTAVGSVGIMRDIFTGEVKLDHTGVNISAPWVQVAKLPTTPVRVCLGTASRAYNCKLAQVDPGAHGELVATEGFRYYWWDNRISFNFGHRQECRGACDLIRGYAFSPKVYPFVVVLNDYIEE